VALRKAVSLPGTDGVIGLPESSWYSVKRRLLGPPRDDLKAALQARWEDSLRARAAISPHSPVPLLDELLAPFRTERAQNDPMTPRATERTARARTGTQKLLSQIPPKRPGGPTPALRGGACPARADLARHQELGSQVLTFGRDLRKRLLSGGLSTG
jgi:hypothetical protein